MRTHDLFKFIRERHAVYERRQRGLPKPWTLDPILQSYRFCNVYRELDTVTIWIADNWRKPFDKDPNLWFAMVVARFINWPDSLAVLGYPKVWKPESFVKQINGIVSRGDKAYTGAYMIHTDSTSGTKAEYLAHKVLTPLWEDRKRIQEAVGAAKTKAHRGLAGLAVVLQQYECMGSFMTGQVIADLKYSTPLRKAPDWATFAVPGPGSQRGLNRVLDVTPSLKWDRTREAMAGSWNANLVALQKEINPLVAAAHMQPLHAQDLQNCLCEFDKYERVRLGQGKPRSLYPGKE